MPISPNEVKWDGIEPAAVKWDSPKPRSWSDVATSAVQAIPASAGSFISGLYQAVRHPLDTAGNLVDLGAGELQKITPAPIRDAINKLDWNPEAAARAEHVATSVNDFYKNRYGSVEGIKNAIATDPVGVAADLSTVLGGAAALTRGGSGIGFQAGRFEDMPQVMAAAQKASKVADVLQKASDYTNPVALALKGVKGAGKAVGFAAKHALGVSTGAGANSVENAAKAGYNGSQAFMENVKGNVPMTDVLERAKQNLQDMMAAKSAEYRQGMAAISGDKTVLDLGDIQNAVDKGAAITNYKRQVTNASAAKAMQAVREAVDNWNSLDPKEFHTPEGLDALKKQIGGILESIPYNERTARAAVGNVYSAVKDSITQQAPTYAKVMQKYSDASDQISEIQRALSLGQKSSADTAMRKLQSLMRNNVQTNYGNRLDLANALEQGGRNELLPAIAGQAMNSWTPRGLVGNIEAAGTLYGSTLNPHFLAALPFQSPRLVGTAAYGAGKAARAASDLGGKFPLTSSQRLAAALLAAQAGRLAQQQ